MFGGSDRIVNEQQKLLAFRVQASAFGLPIPIGWGRNRIPANMIWYGDFTAIPHVTQQSSGGKGGGGVTQVDVTYTYTAALMLLLGEGPITSVDAMWIGKTKYVSAAERFSAFLGTYSQTAWAHLTTNHPSEALAYRGVAYVAEEAYDLGGSGDLPNHNFEVSWGIQQGGGIVDANPSAIVLDVLTNVHYGVGVPSSILADWTQWSNFCRANGVFLSPVLNGQRSAAEFIEQIAKLGGAGIVYSEGKLKMVPYSDESATGNGATYTPDVTPIYALTDDDFGQASNDDPVEVERGSPADAFNTLQVVFSNRANDYNEEPVEAKDQASIEQFGLRADEPLTAPEITTLATARFVCQFLLQRKLYTRNVYKFKLPWQYALLEPMDVLLLTDSGLGLSSERIRIREIEEQEDGGFLITAEEFPTQVAQAAIYSAQAPGGYAPDYNVSPGSVSTPLIIDAPGVATPSGYEVWAAVSGSDASWGGAHVWVSLDGDSYKQVGTLHGRARYGVLTANLPTGSDPDTSSICKVDLTVSQGELLAGTQTDADNAATLCYADGELIAYTAATLTAPNRYDLGTYLRRGVYGTPIGTHLTGASFARLDQAMFRYEYTPDMVGKTIYLKFTSFNIYGGGTQDLAGVTEYQYTIQGPIGSPANVTGFGYSFQGINTKLSWTRIAGDKRYIEYEIRQGVSWEAGSTIARTQSDFLLLPALTTPTTFHIKAAYIGGAAGLSSLSAASTTVTPTAPGQVTPSAAFDGGEVRLTWAVPSGSYQVYRYEVRYGATWAGGTFVGLVDVTTFKALASWSGSRTWWVAAIDAAGVYGTPGSVEVVVTVPSAPTVTAETIDNNVLLRWTDATQTLPLKYYELRRGDVFSSATVIGTVQARFSTIFESTGAAYKYWVVGVDSAGNYGTEQSVTAVVSSPPDFILYDQIDSDFSGTKTNCLVVPGNKLLACVYTSETYQAHFTNRSWDQPQDQIDAGYPIYVEPSQTTGQYVETTDFGTVIPSTLITVSLGTTVVAGTVTVAPTISVKKLSGDPWTDYVGVWQVYVTDFQFVKVTLDFTSSGGNDLLLIDSMTTKLDVKIRNDAGSITANSGDSGGTTVNFNVDFIDVREITVTPQGTTPVTWVVDFTDVPNPSNFKVLVFDLGGSRVTRDIRWHASGS